MNVSTNDAMDQYNIPNTATLHCLDNLSVNHKLACTLTYSYEYDYVQLVLCRFFCALQHAYGMLILIGQIFIHHFSMVLRTRIFITHSKRYNLTKIASYY